jgi:uncharacterized protein (DUF58 family)
MSTLAKFGSLRPTPRGLGVAAIAVVAFALGATAGARSLNAVVVPGLVGLLAAGLQVVRADDPVLERSDPGAGFAGETRRITVDVESDVPCTVTDHVPEGLAVVGGAPSQTVGHGGQFAYQVELRRRGEHRIGPASCRLTDSLGLFSRRVDADGGATTTMLVYPTVHAIDADAMADLVGGRLGHERTSFDRLREFVPGDSMRDVHWRASAKRPAEEFVVAEYGARSTDAHVEIVGEADDEGVDAVATAVASVATHLQDAGLGVTVAVPGGRCTAGPGDVVGPLRLLARTGAGAVDGETRAGADVAIAGEAGRVTVTLPDRTLDADGLVGARRGREVIA